MLRRDGRCQKKLVLYGSGLIGKTWVEHLGEDKVYAIIDSDSQKQGKFIGGKEIIGIEPLLSMKEDICIYISTGMEAKQEIYKTLSKAGLKDCVVGYPMIRNDLNIAWNTLVDTKTEFAGCNALGKGVSVIGCKIGYASYISENSSFQNARIGSYTSIGHNVHMILGQHPTSRFVSTHPIFYSPKTSIAKIGKAYVKESKFEEFRYREEGYSIEIGNDVWVGDDAKIMEGIKVADGTIIASGAMVVKDTEPYSIVGGNPARTIRYRFNKEEIDYLLKLKWWNQGEEWIMQYAECFEDIRKLRKMVKLEDM